MFKEIGFRSFCRGSLGRENAMKLHYDVVHPPSGSNTGLPPLIFLHAMGDWRKTWKKVVPAIVKKTGRKAYLPDARSHGESPVSLKMDYDCMTQDLLEFMDDLDIQKAVVIGHSMGGRTAINFALKHPRRVEMLVVEDMTPQNIKPRKGTLVKFLKEAALECLDSIPSDLDLEEAKHLILYTLVDLVDQRFLYKGKIEQNYDLDMFPLKKVGNKFQGFVNHDAVITLIESNALVQDLPDSSLRFDGQALFLYGDKPFFNLAEDTSIPKLFPKAIVKQIQGSSHYIHVDTPEAFVDCISEFLLQRTPSQSKY